MSDYLKTKIQEKTVAFIKEKKMQEATILRSLMAEIKQFEIDKNNRTPANDTQIINLIDKMIKQRRQAIDLFLEGGRQDLVDKENFEIQMLENYLPSPLNSEEIDQLIQNVIMETQASTPADMGKVMALLKSQVQGRADLSKISQQVKKILDLSSNA